MAIREDLVSSAVTFLQDPSVSASPIENRIAFLQSKNLTQEEVDVALARAGGESAPPNNYNSYAPQQQVMRQPQGGYGGYQPNYSGAWQQPPPELPKRDWRDWFIMATVMGGVGYGLYFVAKRYFVPLIAPPTPPQIEQDKAHIDESFEKAFTLLDQLATDTEALKASEASRTERLDVALTEVETVIGELKMASRRREDESRRINSEVLGLKELIPKAMDGQKESMDTRLTELNNELKSLKKLMEQRGQRMTTAPTPAPVPSYPAGRYTAAQAPSASLSNPQVNGTPGPASTEPVTPKPATVRSESGTGEASASINNRTAAPFNAGVPSGRASIPAWQMAAANKAPAAPAPGVDASSGTKESEASA